MRSIQGRLILATSAASLVLLALTGAGLYHAIGIGLVRQFDESLRAEGTALASTVTINSHGHLDFDYIEPAVPARHQPMECYIIRYADGRPFRMSRRIVDSTAPLLPAGAAVADLALPDGIHGRAMRIAFKPHPDMDDPPVATTEMASAAFPSLNITIARDRRALDDSLHHIAAVMSFAGLLLAAGIIATMTLLVRASLRPLREIAERTTQIDATHLDVRLPAQGLPAELAPIADRLNELLSRLESSFIRERRFTSDVAHELRTPIAELRSLTEVSLRWPDDTALSQDALRHAHAIARQMQTLVTTLLSLVRADGRAVVEPVPVPIISAVASAMHDVGAEARIDLDIPPDATILAEPALLASVLRNILSNACSYGLPGKPILCRARAAADSSSWTLSVENHTTHLTRDDLVHIFEPFWRKDPARSDSTHSGLGLALVQSYCKLMGAQLSADLDDAGVFRLNLTFPQAPPVRDTGFEAVLAASATTDNAINS